MKKLILTFSVLVICTISLLAQTYVSIPWREGVIIKKGKEISGMIRLGGDLGAPYLNNSKVYFVDSKNWIEGKKVKKKVIETYEPEDIDGYSTYTKNNYDEKIDMIFETNEIMIQGVLSKKKGKVFLRLVEEGKVSAYSYVPLPTKQIVSTPEEREKNIKIAMAKATLFLQKVDSNLIVAGEEDLVEYFKDCEVVVDKIKSEEYGFKPKSERPKRKGLGKAIAKNIGDNAMEERIMLAVRDYNACEPK